MWFVWQKKKRKSVRRSKRRNDPDRQHYEVHKEHARVLVHERLLHWGQLYAVSYKRVAIRNQHTRWGSCSTKQNLNFNYRLVFLPVELVDYVIVHELAHLEVGGHGADFWHLAHRYPKAERAIGYLIAKAADGDEDDSADGAGTSSDL